MEVAVKNEQVAVKNEDVAMKNDLAAVKIDKKPDDEAVSEAAAVSTDNPYAYLDRPDFSAEKFKIEIKNLPKIYGINEFRKLLNTKLKLASTKIKAPRRNSPYAFVCFRNNDDRIKAIDTLTNYTWKNRVLEAFEAKPSPDPLVKKRKENADADHNNTDGCKKAKIDERDQETKLMDSTIPLWNMPYSDQLKMKQSEIVSVLKRIGNELTRQNPELREWLTRQRALYDGLPCELLDLRYDSVACDGYRNKCSFTVGIDEESGLRTVGFRIGSYVNGITGVGSVDRLKQVPESMKIAVRLFQDYVRASKLDVFNFEIHSGHFRQLIARTANNGKQLMLVVGIHPQQMTDAELDAFGKSLIDFFTNGLGQEAQVTSLYYQKIVKKEHGDLSDVPIYHLWGDTHIYENLLDLKFRISPGAFFQVNTNGAEILYKSIVELASPLDGSSVLDVCCGTGTIGLCLAKHCNKVLGLEIVPQAIMDAKENAKINKIENSEFFVGKAEDILGSVCYGSNDNIVAIVDPPRSGLHQKAVQQLRKVNKIQKLIYVSCNPTAAMKNFVDLGRPASKTLHNEALVPVKAVAIDMFPHTKHCELIICFERFDKVTSIKKE